MTTQFSNLLLKIIYAFRHVAALDKICCKDCQCRVLLLCVEVYSLCNACDIFDELLNYDMPHNTLLFLIHVILRLWLVENEVIVQHAYR